MLRPKAIQVKTVRRKEKESAEKLDHIQEARISCMVPKVGDQQGVQYQSCLSDLQGNLKIYPEAGYLPHHRRDQENHRP